HNIAPSITSLTATPTINEDGTVTLDGSFTDPGTLDTYSLVVNWGGSEGSETFSLAAGARTFSLTHRYRDDNPIATSSDDYIISVDLTDDDTGHAMASVTTTVNNVNPVVTAVNL